MRATRMARCTVLATRNAQGLILCPAQPDLHQSFGVTLKRFGNVLLGPLGQMIGKHVVAVAAGPTGIMLPGAQDRAASVVNHQGIHLLATIGLLAFGKNRRAGH
jgi:hypothetical protein